MDFFRKTISQTNTNQLITVLETVYADAEFEDVLEIANDERDARLDALLKKSRFDELLLNDASLGLALVKKLVSDAKQPVSLDSMHEMALHKCPNHHSLIRLKDDSSTHCSICGVGLVSRTTCWVGRRPCEQL